MFRTAAPSWFAVLLPLALGACAASPAEPTSPAAPSDGAAPSGDPVQAEPPPPVPTATIAEPAPAPEPPPAKEKTRDPELVGTNPGSDTGRSCSVTDSNGPNAGGKRKDSCPEGEHCVCTAQAGYSCSGTCHRSKP